MIRLRECMTKMAEHHIARGKSFARLAKCAGGLMKTAKSDMGTDDDRESDVDTSEVAAELVALSESELAMASWCVTCCKAMDSEGLSKTQGMDRDGVWPDGLSAVYADDSARMIPRAGSPQPGDLTKLENTVDENLRKFVRLD